MTKTQRSSTFRGSPASPRPRACPKEPAGRRRRNPRAGQAYTEYLVILLFGVFLGLGLVIIEDTGTQDGIMDRLYGYIFDYYAGIANFVNLPIF
jgi:hypothetical protein